MMLQVAVTSDLWEWQGFGFTLVDRLEGNFSNYSIIVNDGQLIVLTN